MEPAKVDNLGFKIAAACWLLLLYLGLMWAWEYHNLYTKLFGAGALLAGLLFLFIKAHQENRWLRNTLFYGSIAMGVVSIAFQKVPS